MIYQVIRLRVNYEYGKASLEEPKRPILASSFYSIRLLDEKERTSKSLVFASRNKI
jgi:hypothetical protein